MWDSLLDSGRQHERFTTLSVKDSEIFEAMTRRIEDRVTSIDTVLTAHDLTDQTRTRCAANVAVDSDDCLHVEFVNSNDVPFAVPDVAKIVWELMLKNEFKIDDSSMTVSP